VAVIMASLAKQMNYNFQNYGVKVTLANPYFPGTAMAQMAAVADAANIYAFIENDETLVIVPKDGARGDEVPVISVDTGMIGYPNAIAPGWISLRTLYNPAIRFMGQINVKSSITAVNGLWRVRRMMHSLESEMPNGQWETDIDASLFDRPGISLNG
jgi:hypothetical protein